MICLVLCFTRGNASVVGWVRGWFESPKRSCHGEKWGDEAPPIPACVAAATCTNLSTCVRTKHFQVFTTIIVTINGRRHNLVQRCWPQQHRLAQ